MAHKRTRGDWAAGKDECSEYMERHQTGSCGSSTARALCEWIVMNLSRSQDASTRAGMLELLGSTMVALHCCKTSWLDVLARLLCDTHAVVRQSTYLALLRLPPAAVAPYASSVVLGLGDASRSVNDAATRVLLRLPAATLAKLSAAIIARLNHADDYVRESAAAVLSRMPPDVLASRLESVCVTRGYMKKGPRLLDVLSGLRARLTPAVASTCAERALTAITKDGPEDESEGGVTGDEDLAFAALESCRWLPSAAVAPHASLVLSGLLHFTNTQVRKTAVRLLMALPEPTLFAALERFNLSLADVKAIADGAGSDPSQSVSDMDGLWDGTCGWQRSEWRGMLWADGGACWFGSSAMLRGR